VLVVRLESSAPGNALLQFVPTPVLDCRDPPRHNARSLAPLGFKRTPIHFYFCWQVDWQEYSEFRNSALLIYRLREADEPTTQNIPELGISENKAR
jgi:hypothetical protein